MAQEETESSTTKQANGCWLRDGLDDDVRQIQACADKTRAGRCSSASCEVYRVELGTSNRARAFGYQISCVGRAIGSGEDVESEAGRISAGSPTSESVPLFGGV